MSPTITHIHLDVDGVLADFDKAINDALPDHVCFHDCHEHEKRAHIHNVLEDLILQEDFFAQLKPMPHCHMMKDLMYDLLPWVDVTIMSSAGKYHRPLVREQKTRWLNYHGFNGFPYILVDDSKYKSNYAQADTLLIDDSDVSVQPYSKVGGNTIQFEYYDQMIEELIAFFNNNESICAMIKNNYKKGKQTHDKAISDKAKRRR